ncbi:MAG: flagellar basal body-associated FliL family protein [bacterium]|nr:flagellar basal body-associated FliL family protein [bacterium]
MADEIGTEEEEPKKGGKGKLIGMIGGGLVLLGAVYFLFLGGGGGEDEAAVTTTTIPVEGPVIEIDEMTITLSDNPVRYARLKFAVVLPEGGDTTVVGEKVPILKDAVLDVVSAYTADELVGPSALGGLREELTARALVVFTEGEVLRVVLTEVLVQ